ncbi:MAG: outer membrane lipoprotein carrier protein LolA [Desulfatitalea sp.]|nr:outer membrane lipoprotein carrier protein LolA [Desulfatitalea sp.]
MTPSEIQSVASERSKTKPPHGRRPYRRKHLWGLALAMLLCVGRADGRQAPTATAVTITSVQAAFVQEKHLPILARPLISEGMLYFQAPGSLRWEYTRPLKSILLVHDGRARRFIRDDAGFREESGANMAAMQVVLEQIVSWMKGRFDESPMFKARLDGQQIILTPKDAALEAVIERIEIRLSQQPGVIDEVLIHEGPEAFTRMRFSQTRLNMPLDPAIFQDVP